MKNLLLILAFLFIGVIATAQTVSEDEAKNWRSLSDVFSHQNINIKNISVEDIKSFEVLIKTEGESNRLISAYNIGEVFSSDIIKILSSVNSESRIWFDNIKVDDPEGKISTISLSLKVY